MRRASLVLALVAIFALLAVAILETGWTLGTLYVITLGGVAEGEPIFMGDPAPPLPAVVATLAIFTALLVALLYARSKVLELLRPAV